MFDISTLCNCPFCGSIPKLGADDDGDTIIVCSECSYSHYIMCATDSYNITQWNEGKIRHERNKSISDAMEISHSMMMMSNNGYGY